MAQVKERGEGGEERKETGLLLPPLSFIGSCFISRAAKTENPVPRSFIAPKPNGNACYADQRSTNFGLWSRSRN